MGTANFRLPVPTREGPRRNISVSRSVAHSMRLERSPAFFTVLGGFAAAWVSEAASAQTLEEADSAARSKHEALNGFAFVNATAPTPSAPTDDGPLIKAPTELSQDPEVVVMEELKVTPLMDRDLGVDIKKTRPLKAASHVKFGTGVHEKDFGKIRASAVTILYVPVLFGFSR